MPDFSEMFLESQGAAIRYKDLLLVMSDYIPFNSGDRFQIYIESTNSEWQQGVMLAVFGCIEIESIQTTVQDRTVFWEHNTPEFIPVRIWGETGKRKQPKRLPKKGLLSIKNIWDTGNGTIQSWTNGAAMIVEEIKNGRRYRCNDGHPDEDFDDIIFTVTRVP